MTKYVNGKIVEMTAEEVSAMKAEAVRWQMEENKRPLTAEEVTALLIRQSVNTLEVDDNTALRMLDYYPAWEADTAYTVGYKVQYDGRLWRCVQAHASQIGWEPEFVPAMWESINETHSGTEDDPIPYEGNMALTKGLHYVQDYVVYRCTRDTGVPIYHALADLTGVYVEEV
jgi:hypothetical protein